jgi:hypothetical protein
MTIRLTRLLKFSDATRTWLAQPGSAGDSSVSSNRRDHVERHDPETKSRIVVMEVRKPRAEAGLGLFHMCQVYIKVDRPLRRL